MKVSVIIPTLDEQAGITACVQAVQKTHPWEIIVVDGGSQDDTVKLARQGGARVVVSSGQGRARQMNLGAATAQGDLLLFLHADCRLPEEALRQIAYVWTQNRRICGAFRQRIEADGWWYRLIETGNAVRAGKLGLPYGDQAIFVARQLFDEVGGFPDYPLMEDVALMRLLRRRVKPLLLSGPLAVSARRWQRFGVVRQTLYNWCFVVAWLCGISPQRLLRHYPICVEPERDRQPSDGPRGQILERGVKSTDATKLQLESRE